LRQTKESKELLGGTNYLLQYIHIMAAYNNGSYNEAQTEMERYFNLVDDVEEPKGFTQIVKRLSDEEATDLVKLLDKIDTHVADNTEDKVRNEADNKNREDLVRYKISEFCNLLDIEPNSEWDDITCSVSGNLVTVTHKLRVAINRKKNLYSNNTWEYRNMDFSRILRVSKYDNGIRISNKDKFTEYINESYSRESHSLNESEYILDAKQGNKLRYQQQLLTLINDIIELTE